MTNSLNSSNQIPAYSGITINITNPTMNPGAVHHSYPICCQNQDCNICHPQATSANVVSNPIKDINSSNIHVDNNLVTEKSTPISPQVEKNSNSLSQVPNSYPAEYYLNNYNIQNTVPSNNVNTIDKPSQEENHSRDDLLNKKASSNQSLETSQQIIQNIDSKVAEQKELEKNSKKTKIVALTNEYIMSLENYLNNPNKDLRIMAAQEILTRLDEDRDRFNDAALNALLNKMLQDPEDLVRTAAMSAFASELASGNDYTVQLLKYRFAVVINTLVDAIFEPYYILLGELCEIIILFF